MGNNFNVTVLTFLGGVFLILTILFIRSLYHTKDRNNNSLLESYQEKYDNLTNSLQNILPPVMDNSCYEDSTDNTKIQDKITGAINDVSGLIVSLQNSYNALKDDPTYYSALTPTQKDTLDRGYNNAVAKANTILTNSKSITVNDKTIKSWNGKYTCEDICQTNGSRTSIDKATYTKNVSCTCPVGYYPQLDSNSLVKCVIYDKTNLLTNITNQIFNIISKADTTFKTPLKFSLLCTDATTKKGIPCPPIPASTTPASTTPASTTPASTTPASTTPNG